VQKRRRDLEDDIGEQALMRDLGTVFPAGDTPMAFRQRVFTEFDFLKEFCKTCENFGEAMIQRRGLAAPSDHPKPSRKDCDVASPPWPAYSRVSPND
jgi:hypothetical protein